MGDAPRTSTANGGTGWPANQVFVIAGACFVGITAGLYNVGKVHDAHSCPKPGGHDRC
jgi:hypothetical protein